MKILIVDDNKAKSESIQDFLLELVGSEYGHSIVTADSLANAVATLSTVAFDVIVLDLLLPYVTDGAPDSRTGLELLKEIRRRTVNNSATVVGLSSFPEEIESSRVAFEQLGVMFVRFDQDDKWKQAVGHIIGGVIARSALQIDLDFLIVCALEEERQAFAYTNFEKVSEAVVGGLNIHYVRLPGDKPLFGGLIRLSQVGLVCSTFEVATALHFFRVTTICMSGICAGFAKEVKLGQLIVASPAWEYQAGKWSNNGFEIAPYQVPLRPGTRALIDQTLGRADFSDNLEQNLPAHVRRPPLRTTPTLAPFATGSAVVADESRLRHIEMQHRKVAGIDMETYGLYFAAHEAKQSAPHFFSAKCVVDLADADKGDDLHIYGSIVSARAVEKLIRCIAAGEVQR